MAAENAVNCRLKKVTYPLRFHNLNSPCVKMRISSHIDVYEPPEDEHRLFIENSMTHVFCQLFCLCPSEGHNCV